MKNKKILQISVTSCLFIVIISLCITFVYAGVTSRLKINGYTKISSSNWNVHFENLSKVLELGSVEEISAPVIQNNSTSITNYDVVFNSNNSSITYKFDVVNSGSIDAEISSITVGKPVCSSSSNHDTLDASNVCDNINYYLTYEDNSNVSEGDEIAAGERISLLMNLEYTGSNLPQNIVDISNLNITIIYSQK